MRIDAHQHFWNHDPSRDSWITDDMSVLRRNFLPTDLLPKLRQNKIDGTIAVQVVQSESETRFLLSLAEQHSFIVGVVGWIDLAAPSIEERLAFFRNFEKLCGFRHIVQAEPDEFMFRADFRRGIAALARFGFTYDILIYPKQLPAAVELAASYPEQKFVLDHLAKPEVRSAKIRDWERQIRQLAACPNVFCKLSGLITEADWTSWQPEDFKEYLDIAFEAFGTQRLMFGSDWPVCLLAGNYTKAVQLVSSYIESLSKKTKDAIFGGNAAQFYGLKGPSESTT
jgi:L-fuconolactonase